MNGSVLDVLLGCALIASGAALILYRSRIARRSAEDQRRLLGRLAKHSAANATPANTAFVGTASILVGGVLLCVGIVGLLRG